MFLLIKKWTGVMLIFHKKICILLFLMGILPCVIAETINPLSKIVITSNNATCSKQTQDQHAYQFQYQENVQVTFADQSKVTADLLEIIFDGQETKNTAKKTDKNLSHFKHITFKNNVCIENANRKAVADCARFYVQDQTCELEGNVKIWQKKEKKSDVPIKMTSQKACMNLVTGQLQFVGSSVTPVSTTIVLEGHPSLQRKKKIKAGKTNVKNSRPATPRST